MTHQSYCSESTCDCFTALVAHFLFLHAGAPASTSEERIGGANKPVWKRVGSEIDQQKQQQGLQWLSGAADASVNTASTEANVAHS